MSILTRFLSRPLRTEVENCIRSAGMVIALRLLHTYAPQYGEQKAAALASAVTNELFGAPPGNEAGRQFLNENKELVETHLRALKTDDRICQIASILAHTKFDIAGRSGTVTPKMVLWITKLREFGILLAAEQVALPSSPEEMRQQVREFELWSMQIEMRSNLPGGGR
jgi:hypothetical protein